MSDFPDEAGVDAGATAWVLTSSALVLLMSLPGLALFYGGFVRAKNVLSVIAACFAITALTTVLWVIIGYSITFTDGGPVNPFIGGVSRVFMAGVNKDTELGRPGAHAPVPLAADAVYQGSYAFLGPALIVGSVVERMKTKAVIMFAGWFLLLVYCPVAHMLWAPGGWMNSWGVLDWAGGLVVGTTAGIAGLVAAVMVGPRRGYPDTVFRPHNMTLVVLGTGMLWTGWIGFEGGTGLKADGVASMAVFTTHVAGAFGALGWTGIEWLLHHGRPSILGFCAGAVAGLAGVTPAAGYVGVAGSAVIGVVSAFVCYVMAVFVKERAGWDESLDAFGVHATGGMVGTILVAILGSPALGGAPNDNYDIGVQLGKQLVGVAFVVAYSVIISFVLLKAIGCCTGGLRVSAEAEAKGLDIAELDDGAYLFGRQVWEQHGFVADAATTAARLVDRVTARELRGSWGHDGMRERSGRGILGQALLPSASEDALGSPGLSGAIEGHDPVSPLPGQVGTLNGAPSPAGAGATAGSSREPQGTPAAIAAAVEP